MPIEKRKNAKRGMGEEFEEYEDEKVVEQEEKEEKEEETGKPKAKGAVYP